MSEGRGRWRTPRYPCTLSRHRVRTIGLRDWETKSSVIGATVQTKGPVVQMLKICLVSLLTPAVWLVTAGSGSS